MEQKNLKNKSRGSTMILSREHLEKHLSNGDLIIEPFDEKNVGPCDINFRISENYVRIKHVQQTLNLHDIPTNTINDGYFVREEAEEYIIQPNEHLLIESLEHIWIPAYLTALIGLRSTFSRLGLSTPPTLIDPGFKGKIVFHLIGSSYPIKLHASMAVFKIILMYVSSNTEVYNGKYQNQSGIVLPKSDPSWRQSE